MILCYVLYILNDLYIYSRFTLIQYYYFMNYNLLIDMNKLLRLVPKQYEIF